MRPIAAKVEAATTPPKSQGEALPGKPATANTGASGQTLAPAPAAGGPAFAPDGAEQPRADTMPAVPDARIQHTSAEPSVKAAPRGADATVLPPVSFASIPDGPVAAEHAPQPPPSPAAQAGNALQTAPSYGIAPSHQDLGEVIDRLMEARLAGRAGEARVAVAHHDFGPVGVRLDLTAASGGAGMPAGLNVSLSSADAAFAPAVHAALAERASIERGIHDRFQPDRAAAEGDGARSNGGAAHGDSGQARQGRAAWDTMEGGGSEPAAANGDPPHPKRSQPSTTGPRHGVRPGQTNGLYA